MAEIAKALRAAARDLHSAVQKGSLLAALGGETAVLAAVEAEVLRVTGGASGSGVGGARVAVREAAAWGLDGGLEPGPTRAAENPYLLSRCVGLDDVRFWGGHGVLYPEESRVWAPGMDDGGMSTSTSSVMLVSQEDVGVANGVAAASEGSSSTTDGGSDRPENASLEEKEGARGAEAESRRRLDSASGVESDERRAAAAARAAPAKLTTIDPLDVSEPRPSTTTSTASRLLWSTSMCLLHIA